MGTTIEQVREWMADQKMSYSILERLKDARKHGLETEVFLSSLGALKENPSLTIHEAINCGCKEWDV